MRAVFRPQCIVFHDSVIVSENSPSYVYITMRLYYLVVFMVLGELFTSPNTNPKLNPNPNHNHKCNPNLNPNRVEVNNSPSASIYKFVILK